jgi:hypothetical protein
LVFGGDLLGPDGGLSEAIASRSTSAFCSGSSKISDGFLRRFELLGGDRNGNPCCSFAAALMKAGMELRRMWTAMGSKN